MSVQSDFIIEGSDEQVQIAKLKGEIASEKGLLAYLCEIYDSLKDDEAVEIKAYREFILIGKRRLGASSVYMHKFINYGLSKGNRTETLSYAIRAIDGGDLPDYCYDAINGNIQALRKTTEHLVKVYNAKTKRLTEQLENLDSLDVMYQMISELHLEEDASYEEVKARLKVKISELEEKSVVVAKRLDKDDDEFLALTEPVLIEIPKCYDIFHNKHDDLVAIIAGDNITP